MVHIPSGVFLFAPDSSFLGRLLFEGIQRQSSQSGQIGIGVTGAHSALIFAELAVPNPVELIFHTPMEADRAGKALNIGRLLKK